MLCSTYQYQQNLGMDEAKTCHSSKISRIGTYCFSMPVFYLEYGFGILLFLVTEDEGVTECGHSTEHKGGTISFSSLA